VFSFIETPNREFRVENQRQRLCTAAHLREGLSRVGGYAADAVIVNGSDFAPG